MGNTFGNRSLKYPSRILQSTGFTPAARMRTRTSPAPGTGFGRSIIFNWSRPPYLSIAMAFMYSNLRMLPDYHTHTLLCKHADGMPLDYVRAAAEKGIPEIAAT